MISCILLSAGESRRFGSPKALAQIQGRTVIESLQKEILSSQNIGELIIVLGYDAQIIAPLLLIHKKVKVVYNKDHKFGQTSSFQVGLRAVSTEAKAVILLPVDYPFIKRETLNLIVENFLKEDCRILIPSYREQKGHPPVFSIILKDEFLGLDKNVGINTVSSAHKKETIILPTQDPGVIKTFNTPDELSGILLQNK